AGFSEERRSSGREIPIDHVVVRRYQRQSVVGGEIERHRPAVTRNRLVNLALVLVALLGVGHPETSKEPPCNPKLDQVFVQHGEIGIGGPVALSCASGGKEEGSVEARSTTYCTGRSGQHG